MVFVTGHDVPLVEAARAALAGAGRNPTVIEMAGLSRDAYLANSRAAEPIWFSLITSRGLLASRPPTISVHGCAQRPRRVSGGWFWSPRAIAKTARCASSVARECRTCW
jgi:hypothetical protein